MSLWQQDKGQKACAKAFIDAITNSNTSPIPIEEIFEIAEFRLELPETVNFDFSLLSYNSIFKI